MREAEWRRWDKPALARPLGSLVVVRVLATGREVARTLAFSV